MKKNSEEEESRFRNEETILNCFFLVLYVAVFSYLLLSFTSDDDTGDGTDGHDNSELAWPSVRSHNILTLVVPPAHTKLGKSGFEYFSAYKQNELQSSLKEKLKNTN